MVSMRKRSDSPTSVTLFHRKNDENEPCLPTTEKDVAMIAKKMKPLQIIHSKRLLILALLASLVCVSILWNGLQLLGKEGKMRLKGAANSVWTFAESHGLMKAAPAFDLKYAKDYPAFKILEENYEEIRKECQGLLDSQKKQMVSMDRLGSYTDSGIHKVEWSLFFFKLGTFIPENESLAPKTAALLHKIPNLYTAFFSVMEPHQHIKPHWGYYKGYLRYHMGVIIPNNNSDKTSYLRVNTQAEENDENKKRVLEDNDKTLIQAGETYYWKNGEGVMFDDTYLHDAHNDSDEVRVVLFLDVARRVPWYLHIFNKISLFVAMREKSVRAMRENAVIKFG